MKPTSQLKYSQFLFQGQIERIGTFEELSENELSYLKRSASEEELEKQNIEININRKRLLSIASTQVCKQIGFEINLRKNFFFLE